MATTVGSPKEIKAFLEGASLDHTERKFRPVAFFAVIGILFLTIMVYEWTAWLLDGGAKPVATGSSTIPNWMRVSLRAQEALNIAGGLAVIWFFLVRPWRRVGHLTLDGMLIIAWLSAWATQDAWLNYTRPWFSYNSHLINLGCPQCYAPGWQSPRVLAEPIVWDLGAYVCGLFGVTVIGGVIMRKVKQRRPNTGKGSLITMAIITVAVADTIAEPAWIALGAFQYPGSIRDVSVWAGRRYQYPLYEAALSGLFMGILAAIRYFKNDKGETLIERGLESVKGSFRRRQGIKLLAAVGAVNGVMFAFFNVPLNYWGLHSENWTPEVINTTYLNGGICGRDTDRACPGPRIPMSVGPDSAYVTPDGRLIAPKGLPNQLLD